MYIGTYKGMDIKKIENAAINSNMNAKVVYYACKTSFCNPCNLLQVWGKSLNEIKKNIDKEVL
jgi:hypothetical protein